MLAGINGAGKTTSIGKLAKYFQAQGQIRVAGAGDTFNAAARAASRLGRTQQCDRISQTTGDSAAVCFDAVKPRKRAGSTSCWYSRRLPTQLHLMEEIKKK